MAEKFNSKNKSRPCHIVIMLVFAVWVVCFVLAWRNAFKLQVNFPSTGYSAYCQPGLIEAVQAVRCKGVANVYGPSPECWPYAHQRLSEMLYPVIYNTPLNFEQLCAGDIFIIFSGQTSAVPATVLLDVEPIRIMEVLQ